MKKITVFYNEKENVYITSYGLETRSEFARWGKGVRNETIIHFVLSGEGFMNGKKVCEGQGFYLERNKIHEYYSSKNKPWSYFWIILNGCGADTFLKKFITPDKNGIFTYNFVPELTTFTKKFFNENKSISQLKAMGIFLILMSFYEKKMFVDTNKYVEEAKKYMECNLYRKLSITEIANFLHISDRYLYNLFIQYEKVSPKEYLSKLKLNYALNYLNEGNLNITEIATSLGFSDIFAFSRFFKKSVGFSPKEYKEKIKRVIT